MNNTQCTCGNRKDARSAKCRACFAAYSGGPTKICNRCQQDKPTDQYRWKLRYGISKPVSNCKQCESERSSLYYHANPEKVKQAQAKWAAANPEKVIRAALRKKASKLGLDPKEVEEYFITHHGQCDICKTVQTRQRLAIDHCHTTGKFRGLLCNECNLGLGMFKDNPDTLAAAIQYLLK